VSARVEWPTAPGFILVTAASGLAAGLLAALPCRVALVWSSRGVGLIRPFSTAVTGATDSGVGAVFSFCRVPDVVRTVETVLVETVVGVFSDFVTDSAVGTLPGMVGHGDTTGVM